ncbi:MAG: hypothetical protein K2L21_01595 [Muribaculaceae bacterium]|nr:hypothetical protein [Muribaculaceae bacterium]
MSKTSTPGVSAHLKSSTSLPMSSSHRSPRPDTLARLRQFARAYTAPVAGFPGVVLN